MRRTAGQGWRAYPRRGWPMSRRCPPTMISSRRCCARPPAPARSQLLLPPATGRTRHGVERNSAALLRRSKSVLAALGDRRTAWTDRFLFTPITGWTLPQLVARGVPAWGVTLAGACVAVRRGRAAGDGDAGGRAGRIAAVDRGVLDRVDAQLAARRGPAGARAGAGDRRRRRCCVTLLGGAVAARRRSIIRARAGGDGGRAAVLLDRVPTTQAALVGDARRPIRCCCCRSRSPTICHVGLAVLRGYALASLGAAIEATRAKSLRGALTTVPLGRGACRTVPQRCTWRWPPVRAR